MERDPKDSPARNRSSEQDARPSLWEPAPPHRRPSAYQVSEGLPWLRAKPSGRWAPLLTLLGLACPACLLDFNQFEAEPSGTGAMTGAGGTSIGGANSDGELTCALGTCSLGSCEPGFFDCDGQPTTGCEHSASTFSEFACGGCDADCTMLGLSNCQSGQCGCATNSECRGAGNPSSDYDCSGRRCICDGDVCNPGETCGRSGGSAECRCGSDSACADGWTCCPTNSGSSCKQLDGSDASNCGACGLSCSTGQVCVGGVCQ